LVLGNPLGSGPVNAGNLAMGLYLDAAGRYVVTSYAADADGLDHFVAWRIIP
jgi:hypothetical protein